MRLRLHHRDLVLLAHGSNGLGETGAVGTKHVGDVFLADQALDELRVAGWRRRIVIVFDAEIVAFVADLDAAGLLDLLDGKLVALPGVFAVGRIRAGLR